MIATNGLNNTIKDNKNLVISFVIIITTFISSFVLPRISRTLLSPKIFDILYNKIDIKLFKICVGYKK